MIIVWGIAGLLFASFLLIVLRGAPFVPTRSADIDELFELCRIGEDGLFVDLGSGDGRVLAAAARRGMRSIGYELNPFLAVYSRWRLRHTAPKPTVKIEDFWMSKLPTDISVVFVFLAGIYMVRLDRKLEREAARIGHDIMLISYGMKIPHRKIETMQGGFVVYRYKA